MIAGAYLPLMLGCLAAYLIGSVSTAIISCRLMGLPDPRSLGSGNPGATNVLRTGSKKAAIITLLGDALKGLLPVLLASALLNIDDRQVALIGLSAFAGHLYPLYYGFKGGKGVATALGVMLGYSWPCFLAVAGTWLLMAWLFRYSALAALTGFALAPVYLLLLHAPPAAIIIFAVMTALIFWRHRTNISRLLAGTESKIGAKG